MSGTPPTTWTLWPALGANGVSLVVYAEDGVTVIPAITGAVVPYTKFYTDLVYVAATLRTSNPLEASGDPITIPPYLKVTGAQVGVVSTSLAARSTALLGETLITSGRAALNDGGGATWQSVVSGTYVANGYTVIDGIGCQWNMLDYAFGDRIKFAWFGVVADDTTNCHAAFVAAFALAAAKGILRGTLPPGTCYTDPLVGLIPNYFSFLGEGKFASFLRFPASTGGGEDACIDLGSREATRLQGFQIVGSYTVNPLTSSPAVASRRHGIRITGGNQCTIEDFAIADVSGSGIETPTQCLNFLIKDGYIRRTGVDNIHIYGGTPNQIDNVTLGAPGKGCYGMRVDAGKIEIRGVNGLYNVYNVNMGSIPNGPDNVGWLSIGGVSAGAADISASNIEAFTQYGVHCGSQSTYSIRATDWFLTYARTCRASYWALVDTGNDGPGVLDGTCRLYNVSGSWGSPGGAADGAPFEAGAGGMPIFCFNKLQGQAKIWLAGSSVLADIPTFSFASTANAHLSIDSGSFRSSRFVLAYQLATSPANTAPTTGLSQYDSTPGAQTVALPYAYLVQHSPIWLVNTGTANNATFNCAGGDRVYGPGADTVGSTSVVLAPGTRALLVAMGGTPSVGRWERFV